MFLVVDPKVDLTSHKCILNCQETSYAEFVEEEDGSRICVQNCSGTHMFSNFSDYTCHTVCPNGVYETIYSDLN